MKTMILAVLLLAALGSPPLQAQDDNLKAFPPADAGMTRHVLNLPAQADEESLRVELIVGKTVRTDAENRYFFGGAIEAETIQGWGYTRYVVRRIGPMAGTLMAVNPDAPKVDRFIALAGEPYLIRYNSRLPVVVYVPKDAEVRHRVWRAEPEARPVPEG